MLAFELLHRNGDRKGDRLPLQGKRLLIGRGQEADLQLDTPDVSRKHCVLIRSKKGIYVQDLGSRNGTKLNGVKIDRERPVRLSHRDKLQVGHWKFRCLITEPTDQPVRRPDKTDKPSEQSQPRTLLDELDELATTIEFSSFHRLVQADLPQSPTSESHATETASKATEASDAVKHKSVEARELNQETKPKPNSSDSPKNAEEKSTKEPEKPVGPQKLPEHLRPKGPRDSTQAADLALRKLLGG